MFNSKKLLLDIKKRSLWNDASNRTEIYIWGGNILTTKVIKELKQSNQR